MPYGCGTEIYDFEVGNSCHANSVNTSKQTLLLSNSICCIIFKTKGGQIKPPINQIYTI
mgnify:CR=1 FL=1